MSDSTREPRGLRNCNPGNIVRTSPRAGWLGAVTVPTDPRFEQFTAPLYGIRALAVTLHSYQERDGCRTPGAIVRRFAPAVENNTSAYVACISQALGVTPDHPVDLRDPALMAAAIKAIVRHENGWNPYSDSLIARAVEMAASRLEGSPVSAIVETADALNVRELQALQTGVPDASATSV